MKFNNKYRIFSHIIVIILLVAFNLVSFGKGIHECFCRLNEKPVIIESCCKKEIPKTCCSKSSTENENKNCNSEKNFCTDCEIVCPDMKPVGILVKKAPNTKEIIQISYYENSLRTTIKYIQPNIYNKNESQSRTFIDNSVLRI